MTAGYVLSRYPLLSETFILREMLELERQGHTLFVYPLRAVPGKRHPRVNQLRARVWKTPWLALGAHLYWLRRRPRAYLSTLAAIVWRNRSDANLWLGAVAYWGKAVAIAQRARVDGIDHIHAHYATHPALAAYVIHRLAGLPYSVTVHAHDIFCHQAMLAEKLRAAQSVVAISELNRSVIERAWAASRLRPPFPPLEVVHSGVEWERYARIASARTAFPPDRRALRLLAVGSLQPYKGHRFLVDACALLRQRGLPFTCRIVGGGELVARLRRQIRRLHLERMVWLEGPGDEAEVMAALAWADVFALPSVRARNGKMEGIPVALMEAMAAGLPVIASRLSGIPEIVVNERNGALVPPGDAAALAQAITRLRDAPLRRRWGSNGARTVAAEFNLGANVVRLAALWTQTPPVGVDEAAA